MKIVSSSENLPIFAGPPSDSKKIIVIFPITRYKDSNQWRLEKLIRTVNDSDVSSLVIFDKTEDFSATTFFAKAEPAITPNLIIFQRPISEQTHDSQRLLKAPPGTWVIQLHDDDDWDGFLRIPDSTDEDSIIFTSFFDVSRGTSRFIAEIDQPECRAVFSLLPSKFWNRFTELISLQGNRVAGSIDSSLNSCARIYSTKSVTPLFAYKYDNRHWATRKSAKKQLIRIATEDGWPIKSAIQLSLVGRKIDAIACLMFFQDFFSPDDRLKEISKWMTQKNPRRSRIIFAKTIVAFGKVFSKFSALDRYKKLHLFRIGTEYFHANRVMVSSWTALCYQDLLATITLLEASPEFDKLRPRFIFWRSQLSKEQIMPEKS